MGADAKIDLEKVRALKYYILRWELLTNVQNIIHINRPPAPLYQTVIEKTRGLAFRTQALGAAMNRRAAGETAEAGDDGKGKGKGRRTAPGGTTGGASSASAIAQAVTAEA